MDLLTLALACLILFLTIYFWCRHQESATIRAFSERNLKYVSLGNFLTATLRKERIELTKSKAINKEGPVFGFTMMNKYTIMIADAEMAGIVLSKQFTNFTNRREFPVFAGVFGENVGLVPDVKWKRLRSIITPAFSVGKLKAMKPSIDLTIQTLLKNMDKVIGQQSSTQNAKELFDSFTMDTIIKVAFGVQVNSLADSANPIILNGRAMLQQEPGLMEMLKMTVLFMIPSLASFINVDLFKKEADFFTKLSEDIMAKKRSERGQNSGGGSSFIDFMLEAEAEAKKLNDDSEAKKSSKYMTNSEIIANCIMFFLAGFDTTSATLTLSAYQLARHPEIQEKLHQEILKTIETLRAESDDPKADLFSLFTYETQSRFEYLNAVINEALRLDPPVYFLERAASVDTELVTEDRSLPQVKVKAGDIIHIPLWSMHRDPVYFPNPESFVPERFLGEPTFPKYAYLPFGGGPRNCLARSLALFEARLALLHVVLKYRFELSPQTTIPPQFTNQFDLLNLKELKLKFVKR